MNKRYNRGIYWLLGFFFIVFSVGIFHKFGRMAAMGDEIHVVYSTLKFFRDFHFADPYAYAFPITTLLYIPFLAVSFVSSFVLGVVTSISGLKELVILEPYKFVPIFRFATIIFSLITIFYFYKICLFVFREKKWALTGAYLLGTSFIFTKVSFMAIKWMPQLMLIVVTIYYFLKLLEKPDWKLSHYICSGILVAANYGIDIVGLVVVFPFALIFYKAYRKGGAGDFKKGLAIFFIIVIILGFLITVSSSTLAQSSLNYAFNVSTEGAGEPVSSTAPGYRFFGYFEILFRSEILLLILAATGAFLAYKYNKFIFGLFGLYFAVYYIMLGPVMSAIRQRRALLLIPVLAIFSVFTLRWLSERIKNHNLRNFVFLILMSIFLINPFLIRHELIKIDSKKSAREWIENNITENSVIQDECLLELEENREVIEYTRDNYKDFFTTKQKYLLSHSDLLKTGKRFFLITDPNKFAWDYIHSHGKNLEHYFVYCYAGKNGTAEYEKEFNSLLKYFRLSEIYGDYDLEKVYDSTIGEKFHTQRPHYLIGKTNPLYLLESYRQSYNDDHVRIYKILWP